MLRGVPLFVGTSGPHSRAWSTVVDGPSFRADARSGADGTGRGHCVSDLGEAGHRREVGGRSGQLISELRRWSGDAAGHRGSDRGIRRPECWPRGSRPAGLVRPADHPVHPSWRRPRAQPGAARLGRSSWATSPSWSGRSIRPRWSAWRHGAARSAATIRGAGAPGGGGRGRGAAARGAQGRPAGLVGARPRDRASSAAPSGARPSSAARRAAVHLCRS